MNPGNLVRNNDPTAITSQLRTRPDDSHFVHAADVPTFFAMTKKKDFLMHSNSATALGSVAE